MTTVKRWISSLTNFSWPDEKETILFSIFFDGLFRMVYQKSIRFYLIEASPSKYKLEKEKMLIRNKSFTDDVA